MKNSSLIIWFLIIFIGSGSTFAQEKFTLTGSIVDVESNEALIGAVVLLKAGTGAVTDIDGNFKISAEAGTYDITITYVGYESQKMKIKLTKNLNITVKLQSQTLDEVEVVADVAKIRETPVAFSNISQTKIAEELGSRDISMMINSTPGAYATEQGGGSGDSRVTLRGFDQRNIGVLVDGVPVNDMENGQVYWSNWDGLSEITRTMQVQRGLGASKLAISSVGGTMNIITKGIDTKKGFVIKKDFGNNNYQRIGLAYTSGYIKNKFGITLAGSYKTGDGWVDQTWTKAWSYFAKFQWKINSRNLISLGVNGAPQQHGQRVNKLPIAFYNEKTALDLGMSQAQVDSFYKQSLQVGYSTYYQREKGLRYNSHWGYLNGGAFNERVNYYHKPLFSLSHFWGISERINLSTVMYASYGNGGGTLTNTFGGAAFQRDSLGLLKIQDAYNSNSTSSITSITQLYDPGHKASYSIVSNENNHKWYGGLSTLTFKIDSSFTYTAGIDLRYYKGIHFGRIYDLMGADWYLDNNGYNPNSPKGTGYYTYQAKHEGEKYSNRDYVGFVSWGGVFNQVEYKKKKWAAFVTTTFSETNYRRLDYGKKKDLLIDGEVYAQKVGWHETFFISGDNEYTSAYNDIIKISGDTARVYASNGTTLKKTLIGYKSYTSDSPEAKTSEVKYSWQLGYTIKGGANYNINEHQNVYSNIGIMQIAPRFDNVLASNNTVFAEIRPQHIYAFELGYGLKYSKFACNVNAYYTDWRNKPENSKTVLNADGTQQYYNINGVDALHIGIESDALYKPLKHMEIEVLASYADWRYNSSNIVYGVNDIGTILDTINFDAKGVHVGNAAQVQLGSSIRYEFGKGFYVKPRVTYFGKQYANIDATSLIYKYDATATVKDYVDLRGRESWKMPDYALIDLNGGYEFVYSGLKLNLSLSVNNLLNTKYISDAQNNGAFGSSANIPLSTLSTGFNARGATVFFGQGRRYVIGIRATF